MRSTGVKKCPRHCFYRVAPMQCRRKSEKIPKWRIALTGSLLLLHRFKCWRLAASLSVGGKPCRPTFRCLALAAASHLENPYWFTFSCGPLAGVPSSRSRRCPEQSEISHKWDYCCKSRPRKTRQRPDLMFRVISSSGKNNAHTAVTLDCGGGRSKN